MGLFEQSPGLLVPLVLVVVVLYDVLKRVCLALYRRSAVGTRLRL